MNKKTKRNLSKFSNGSIAFDTGRGKSKSVGSSYGMNVVRPNLIENANFDEFWTSQGLIDNSDFDNDHSGWHYNPSGNIKMYTSPSTHINTRSIFENLDPFWNTMNEDYKITPEITEALKMFNDRPYKIIEIDWGVFDE